MRTRWWIGPSIAVVAIALAHCGGDDSSSTMPTGSGGSTGSGGGSGGSATGGSTSTGSPGTGGSTSTGASGSGGSATGGSGGGTAGSTGTAGAGGAMGGSPGDGGPGGGGAKADGAAGGVLDAAGDRVIPADAAMCPAMQPKDGDACVVPPVSCTYGNTDCLCTRVAGGREWRCGSDAGSMCNCPMNPPQRNSACADAGVVAGCTCMYPGNNLCVCDQLDQWICSR